jgi:hypothetical protein
MAETLRDTECPHLRQKGIRFKSTAYELRVPGLWEVRRLCDVCAADDFVLQRLQAAGFRRLGEDPTHHAPHGQT